MRLGDLDALKKTIEDEATFIDGDSVYKIIDIIDNAPPVETDIEVVAKDAYKQGYTDGWKERFGEPDERPQGEWVKVKEERMSVDMSGEIVTRYKCSKCGRVIATFPSKLAGYYPFCHCGAKMKVDTKGDM